MTKTLLILLAGLTCSVAYADDTLEFPEEELARETVLPVFQTRRVVLNRNVVTDKRLEFGAGVGLEMNEPYYADYMGQIQATYNLTDVHAINVQGLLWAEGLSSYGEQLKAGSSKFLPFDATPAPHPKHALMANYQFVAYYGKISITKRTVMNLNLFALAGLGYLSLDSQTTIGANVGLGQNFFFTRHFGLRADLRLFMYQGPNPPSPGDPKKAVPATYEDRTFFNTQLGLTGIIVL